MPAASRNAVEDAPRRPIGEYLKKIGRWLSSVDAVAKIRGGLVGELAGRRSGPCSSAIGIQVEERGRQQRWSGGDVTPTAYEKGEVGWEAWVLWRSATVPGPGTMVTQGGDGGCSVVWIWREGDDEHDLVVEQRGSAREV
ncbi:hypothetical protein M6B38_383125 [Iris pallida]|uniref:Uncharacterized protein n=1 Tax=Iris pallida TaxID=29817 RepID=A0AAX6G582_IRIPA|nr:hypothetical protein M6B38_383125 [Iris pallida]